MTEYDPHKQRGPIAWMTRNSVAANLLMIILLIGGLMMATRTQQEFLPDFELDVVNVSVSYPGASPEEVERAIVQSVEEEVRGIDGVDEISSVSSEGSGFVSIDLLAGARTMKVYQDIQSAVDRIRTFPTEAEEPQVSLQTRRRNEIRYSISGDLPEATLRQLGDDIRDQLLLDNNITQIDLSSVRDYEVWASVSRDKLREYNLTLTQVAQVIEAAAVELPGGGIKTRGGEILLRMQDRRDYADEFAQIPIVTTAEGSVVRLDDIAEVRDTFQDEDLFASYNGQPAIELEVYRVGKQTPIGVATASRRIMKTIRKQLPPNVHITELNCFSDIFKQRAQLLLKNGALGLVLVLVLLGLFLETRLALWVAMGIPISFLGTFLFLPMMDQSINMISMFAFILALGIVVDDAIVVGENIYDYLQCGEKPIVAAMKGAREVAVPVTFSVLTNVVAFVPLMLLPGTMGKFWKVIPIVVISAFLISLVESLFVLPTHLGHRTTGFGRFFAAVRRRLIPLSGAALVLLLLAAGRNGMVAAQINVPLKWINAGFWGLCEKAGAFLLVLAVLAMADRLRVRIGPKLHARQQNFSHAFKQWVADAYGPFLEKVLHNRYLTISIAGFALILTMGLVKGERITRIFMPTADAEYSVVTAALPYGSDVSKTQAVEKQLIAAAEEMAAANGGKRAMTGVFSSIGSSFGGVSGGHVVEVRAFLPPAKERALSTKDFTEKWREQVGSLSGVDALVFESDRGGPGGGRGLSVELTHSDNDTLNRAAEELAVMLEPIAVVADVDDGYTPGKVQFDVQLLPDGQALGLTSAAVARQLRDAFYGAEALRQQRGRNEVKLLVRYPESEQRSEYDLDSFLVRTPAGTDVPLNEVATVTRGRAYTSINRRNGQRTVTVTANVVPQKETQRVLNVVQGELIPQLQEKYPRLGFSFEGRQADRKEAMDAMAIGFAGAMFVIYAMLAIPFRSYIQPLIVMLSIPFGIVGAVAGHMLMGYSLSVMSMMGIVALAGVVVNDSLVLIDFSNRLREEGLDAHDAVTQAGIRRFRPIILTTLTTFLGLAPMIFETSRQARFLIPMAISLGFGILFATLITLVLVPALYMVIEDVRNRLSI